MTKNKDKTLTFSHYKAFTFNPQKTSDKEAKKSLANQLWDKGYVPLDITIDGYSSYRRLVSCVCAYAGKKQARKIGAFKKIFKEYKK